MEKEFIYNFLKQHESAVVSTISNDLKPEAALVGFAVSEDLEIIFDTLKTSRKYQNLVQNPYVAVVIGWEFETSVQYEGNAVVLTGQEADYFKEIYFGVFKDGRERAETWSDIVHFKIKPTWVRYSDFTGAGVVEEINF